MNKNETLERFKKIEPVIRKQKDGSPLIDLSNGEGKPEDDIQIDASVLELYFKTFPDHTLYDVAIVIKEKLIELMEEKEQMDRRTPSEILKSIEKKLWDD